VTREKAEISRAFFPSRSAPPPTQADAEKHRQGKFFSVFSLQGATVNDVPAFFFFVDD
jgi:hypothetical protein